MPPTQSNIPDTSTPALGGVPAILPLCLLESLRAHDRPSEVLEDEDLAASLPRRLGLSDVIDSQIRRYEEARRKGRTIPGQELVDLLRLVIRRPDDEAILEEAGRRVVERFATGGEKRRARLGHMLPRRIAVLMLRRALGRLARRISAGARVEISKEPLTVRLHGCVTARVDPGGVACLLYTSAFGALARRYSDDLRVSHPRCEAQSAEACEWVVRS